MINLMDMNLILQTIGLIILEMSLLSQVIQRIKIGQIILIYLMIRK